MPSALVCRHRVLLTTESWKASVDDLPLLRIGAANCSHFGHPVGRVFARQHITGGDPLIVARSKLTAHDAVSHNSVASNMAAVKIWT